jgi:hypothetical protein
MSKLIQFTTVNACRRCPFYNCVADICHISEVEPELDTIPIRCPLHEKGRLVMVNYNYDEDAPKP